MKNKNKLKKILVILIVMMTLFSSLAIGNFFCNQIINSRKKELATMTKVYEQNLLMMFQQNLNYSYDLEILVYPENLDIVNIKAKADEIINDEGNGVEYISLIIGDTIQNAWTKSENMDLEGKDIGEMSYVYVLSKVKGELIIEGPITMNSKELFLFLLPIKYNNGYWGQVVTGMDKDHLLKELNLSMFEDKGYEYQIWKVDTDTGGKDIIATSNKNTDFSDAERLTMYLPTQWNFLLIPNDGWLSFNTKVIIYSLSILMGVLILVLLYLYYLYKKQIKKIESISQIDFSTKMNNYTGFINALDKWIDNGVSELSLIYFVIEGYGHVAPMVKYEEEKEYLLKIHKSFGEIIKNRFISGRIGDGRFVVAIYDNMTINDLNDLAKAISLSLIWRVRLDEKKIFLEAKYQYATYPENGRSGKELINYLSTSYYQSMKNESPIQSMIEKCNQLALGEENVVFDKYTDVQMMQLSMAINQYRKRVEQVAYYDPVFQIGNRIKYIRDAKMLIAYDKKRKFNLYCIDIVSFGSFNELFNVQTGDSVLKVVIERLSDIFNEYLYRINGDVFLGITFKDENPTMMIKKIQQQLHKSMFIGNTKLSLTVNIGVSLYPKHADNAEALLEQVQVALRYAKNSKNGEGVIYNYELLKLLREENDIYQLLIDSMQNNTLEVWYQPLMKYDKQKYTAVEALLRLKGKDGKYIQADRVIAIAERRGIMERVGDYILSKACTFYKNYGNEYGLERIGINISVQQFMIENSAEHILSIIEASGIESSVVSLEITETMLIQSLKHMENVLNKLRANGIHIILDDFGVGYSSLNYLSNLPVDGLKVDRSLTASVVSSEKQLTLLHAIVNMAKINNLWIVAEGVESAEELESIVSARVDYIQGYYYSKALNEKELIKLLKNN